jgi:AcrR family transcriptional regulator
LGIAEEITVQREDVLGQALQLLEIQGIASTTLEMVADRIDYPLDELKRFWPDKEALFMMPCAISASRLISGAGS